jgi:hypothetical protein
MIPNRYPELVHEENDGYLKKLLRESQSLGAIDVLLNLDGSCGYPRRVEAME